MKNVLSAISYLGMTRKALVNCEISKGVGIHIIGIPDPAIKEGLLRVASAMQKCGYKVPGQRIVVRIEIDGINTAAANLPIGVYQSLDLAIAIAILSESGQVKLPVSEEYFVGMLTVDGQLKAPFTGLKDSDDSASVIWYAIKPIRLYGWCMSDLWRHRSWKSRGGLLTVTVGLN